MGVSFHRGHQAGNSAKMAMLLLLFLGLPSSNNARRVNTLQDYYLPRIENIIRCNRNFQNKTLKEKISPCGDSFVADVATAADTNHDNVLDTRECQQLLNELVRITNGGINLDGLSNATPIIRALLDDDNEGRIRPERLIMYALEEFHNFRCVGITEPFQDCLAVTGTTNTACPSGRILNQASGGCDPGPRGVGGGCFPGSATVHLPGGDTKQMKHLQLGDQVLTNGGTYTEFLGWTDKDTDRKTQFLRIVTKNASSVTLTANHNIYVYEEKLVTKYAQDVNIGDLLVNLSGELEEVTDITIVQKQGYYSPLTTTGDLFVDQLLSSCYASFPHDLAHAALYPARTWPRLFLEDDHSLQEDGTRGYVRIIKKLGDFLIFRKSTVDTTSFWGEHLLAAVGLMTTY